MNGSSVKALNQKGNLSFGKYMGKNMGMGVPIISSVGFVSVDIADIVSSSEQTLRSMEEMIRSVNTVIHVSESAAVTTETIEKSTSDVTETMKSVATAAQSLLKNAFQLQQEVEQFKV